MASWKAKDSERAYGFVRTNTYDPASGAQRGELTLRSHRVHTVILGGLARTQLVEELTNGRAGAVEAQVAFTSPDGASVSRFALGNAHFLQEAEVFDSDQIALIPRGPVTEHRQDEWPGSNDKDTFRMRIVGFAPKQTRTLVLAYDEALEQHATSEVYRYLLPRVDDSGDRAREFSIDVTLLGAPESFGKISTPNYPAEVRSLADRVTVTLARRRFLPGRDFTVEIERMAHAANEVRIDVSGGKASNAHELFKPSRLDDASDGRARGRIDHVSFRLELPSRAESPSPLLLPSARVIVLDKSYAQSAASFLLQRRLVRDLLLAAENEHYALLACDSACSAWPKHGVTSIGAESAAEGAAWLDGLSRSGSFDLEGALARAAALLELHSRAQIVLLGATPVGAGRLEAVELFAAAARTIARKDADLRVFGVGPARDEAMLLGLAMATNATYGVLSVSIPSELQATDILRALRAPKLTEPKLELPPGVHDPVPSHLPALVFGQSLRVTAAAEAPLAGALRITGKLQGRDYAASYPVALGAGGATSNPLVARRWAEERLREVDRATANSRFEFGASQLSRNTRIASRHTDWLLLESEREYRDYRLTRALPTPSSAEVPKHEAFARGTPIWSPPYITTSSTLRPRGAFPERAPDGLVSAPTWMQELESPFPPLIPATKVTLNFVAQHEGDGSKPERDPIRREEVRTLQYLFYRCYERGVARTEAWFQGRLAFELRIGARGALESLAAEAEPTRDVRSLFECFRWVARQVTYEPPLSGNAELHFYGDFTINWSRGLKVFYQVPKDWVSGSGAFSAIIAPGDDKWQRAPSSSAAEALAVAVLGAQSSDQSMAAALRGVEREPSSRAALDLLATAAGAENQRALLLAALEAKLSLSPTEPELRRRIAHGWLAAGDDWRACAHLRSLGGGEPDSNLRLANELCRTNWLGEPGLTAKKPALESPRAILARGLEEPDVGGACHPFTVTVHCDASQRCPIALVLTPEWQVISEFSSMAGKGSVDPLSFWPATHGTYRVLLLGGEPLAHGTVDVAVHLDSQSFAFHRGGASQTVASVDLISEKPGKGAIGIPMCGGALK